MPPCLIFNKTELKKGTGIMKNFVQPGHSLECVAPSGGVTSGEPVLINNLLVIPSTNADAGEKFAGHIDGVYSVDKATGAAWAIGETVYWDNSAGKFTKTATSNYKAGVAGAVAASGDTTGVVRLNGVGVTQEAGA